MKILITENVLGDPFYRPIDARCVKRLFSWYEENPKLLWGFELTILDLISAGF